MKGNLWKYTLILRSYKYIIYIYIYIYIYIDTHTHTHTEAGCVCVNKQIIQKSFGKFEQEKICEKLKSHLFL